MNLNDSIIEDEATNDYSSYWQSIPDPITPAAAAVPEKPERADHPTAAASRRRKRRESSAVVVPLKDVTNAIQNNDDGNHRDILKGIKKSATADEFESLFAELERDDDDDDDDEPKKMRREIKSNKKRRSMLLPSDDGVDLLSESLSGREVTESETNETGIQAMPSNVKENDDNFNSTSSKREMIISLIRKYTSLPPNERLNSQESHQIESLSTYPMPGKVIHILQGEDAKQQFLIRAKPIVDRMEEQKQRDITDAKEYTGCVVKKVKKVKGGFEYWNQETGREVTAEDYMVRYCAMLEERKRRRRGERDVVDDKFDTTGSVETSPFEEDSNMDMDESVFSPDDSIVQTGDDGSIVSSVRTSDDRLTICSSSNKESESSCGTRIQESLDQSWQNKASTYSNSSPQPSNDSAPHPLVGSLPPSNDPRVLEARRKLFRSIDMALATYSREILALARDSNVSS